MNIFKKLGGKVLSLIFEEDPKEPQQIQEPRAVTQTPVKASQPNAPKTYKVTGVKYYLDNIKLLRVANEEYTYGKRKIIEMGLTEQAIYQYNYYPKKAELVPEPENPHDPNAIKVMVDNLHVGYIKKGSCAHLLNVIREGRIKKIDCTIEGGRYVYLFEDYEIDDRGREKTEYTLERDEDQIRITLYITEEKVEQTTRT